MSGSKLSRRNGVTISFKSLKAVKTSTWPVSEICDPVRLLAESPELRGGHTSLVSTSCCKKISIADLHRSAARGFMVGYVTLYEARCRLCSTAFLMPDNLGSVLGNKLGSFR